MFELGKPFSLILLLLLIIIAFNAKVPQYGIYLKEFILKVI